MSCEQFSLPAALKKKEWMYVNCKTVSCDKLINGDLTYPATAVANGDYIINANANLLSLVASSPVSSVSYFQATGLAPYSIPVGIPTALQLSTSSQEGSYLYDLFTYHLTIIASGTYRLTLNSTMANNTGSINTCLFGFNINGTQQNELQVNQSADDTNVCYNSFIVSLIGPSTVYPYANSTILPWVFYSTSFMVERIG
jgi:hypothetical protein